MLDTSDSIALTAFVVSIIALAATASQLLQQYFTTAYGYNRCSRRFIGDWSRFRHRRYIWREFRFETTFVRPHIYIGFGDAKFNAPAPLSPSWNVLDLIPSVRKDNAWRSKYLGKSILISQLGDDFSDVRTHVSWTLFLQHIKMFNDLSNRRMQRFSSSSHAGADRDSETSRLYDQLSDTDQIGDRELEDGSGYVLSAKADRSVEPTRNFGICVKFEPCTWDDLPGTANILTGTVSIRDLAVFGRLLGLQWNYGPFMGTPGRVEQQGASAGVDTLPERGGFQAVGNSLALTEKELPQLRYEQREQSPPEFRFPRMETFIIHRATVAMFYGHIIPDDDLLPGYLPIRVGDSAAWESRLQQMWIHQRPAAPSTFVHCLVPLLSTVISDRFTYAVRVPKPHQFTIGPFARPKITETFRETVDRVIQSCNYPDNMVQERRPGTLVRKIAAAIDDLRQYPRRANTGVQDLNYWTVCQGEASAWAHFENDNNKEAEIFFHKVHDYIDMVQEELSSLIRRKDAAIGTYTHLYFDLVSAFFEFAIEQNNNGPSGKVNKTRKGPIMQWRATMEALFDNLNVIEASFRERGKRRAIMHANGMSAATLGDQFDVVVRCEGIRGYDSVDSDEIREATIAMVFRAMCWFRCHFMNINDRPFNSDFYTNLQKAAIE
ncbi:hypothetical protein BDV39DRAFT_170475 [Aspergillus sergii]|uniref:Developmental regulator Mod-A n=1 Tax=Aspergillus sergii TaxID=1034303 RepID=A0A5N6XFK6_9EURO|nr:hypothetical protein BDV39DRAFT_170475 [Aspergillus sergii]